MHIYCLSTEHKFCIFIAESSCSLFLQTQHRNVETNLRITSNTISTEHQQHEQRSSPYITVPLSSTLSCAHAAGEQVTALVSGVTGARPNHCNRNKLAKLKFVTISPLLASGQICLASSP